MDADELALVRAAEDGDWESVRRMLAAGRGAAARDAALHAAAFPSSRDVRSIHTPGNLEAARALLEHGADVRAGGDELMRAAIARGWRDDVVDLFASFGAPLDESLIDDAEIYPAERVARLVAIHRHRMRRARDALYRRDRALGDARPDDEIDRLWQLLRD